MTDGEEETTGQEPLVEPNAQRLSCFVIAPIGEPESATRRRSDQILKHVINPVLLSSGYGPALRADGISESGQITRQIITHVLNDDLVIADLTGSNPNVFYELALRHAVRKPFVQLLARGESLPFDVAPQRTIFIDHRDLDSAEDARLELERQLSAFTRMDFELETPISVVLDVAQLKSSDDPTERTQGDIVTMLQLLVARTESGPLPAPAPRVSRPSISFRGVTNTNKFILQNAGPGIAFDVRVTASAGNSGVSFAGQYNFDQLKVGEREELTLVAKSVPSNLTVTITFQLNDSSEDVKRYIFNVPKPPSGWDDETPF